MPTQFQWLQYAQARQLLSARLADPSQLFWTDAEVGVWLAEALRTWNALTETFKTEFAFTATSAATWYDLATMASSPRLRTLTDNDLVTAMEYHLLEPPNGNAAWSGSSQFSLNDLEGALQRRRDQMIQMTGCNVARNPNLASTPNVARAYFDDTVLEPQRVRFVQADSSQSPVTLTREDMMGFDYFEPDHVQTSNRLPRSFSVYVGPPLAMDVDYAPNVPGKYEVIYLKSGNVFAPPAATLLNVPDDWAWVVKWGALADVLGRESEATDRERAAYALKRFNDGMKIMQQSNWVLRGLINNVPCDTPSLAEMDAYVTDWELKASAPPSVVTAGIDFIAPAPVRTGSQIAGCSVTLVQNAPVPVLDADYVQVSRDDFDVILDYAQHLCAFKMGGADFAQTKTLYENFMRAAMAKNDRLSHLGIFTDLLKQQGQRENMAQPRFSGE